MITRTNYEDFFLLYIDNELSASDRQRVEAFVTENPDLAEEWEALLQCRILPEEEQQPVFGNKSSLLRSIDDDTINDDNYTDYFLSYIDGELGVKDRQLVENFLRLHPSKGTELEKWRQTISRPDPTILFPDKESLYRKETGRRIVFPLWRLAAAAVVLGVIGWWVFHSGASVTPGNTGSPALAGTAPKKSDGKITTAPVTPATASPLYSSGSGQQPDNSGIGTSGSQTAVLDRTAEKIKRTAAAIRTQEPKTALPAATTNTASATKPTVEKITHPDDNAIAADPGTVPGKSAIADPDKSDAVGDRHGGQDHYDAQERRDGHTIAEVAISRENSSFATQALLKSSIASSDDDNFEPEPAALKKNKLRGIFRRVSRAFEKTADRDDDGQRKVLIGAFQVSLK